MRLLCKGDAESSEIVNDLLAQVATNTETANNPGNAIVYECVQTILGIECESGLRVLAINILGRFLVNRDNNIRYVALNTLVEVVHMDIAAVQRHRQVIMDCLKDPDVSIRRRALELAYVLVTESNVEPMVKELVSFLAVADAEFKEDLTSRLCTVIDKFAPNLQWHADTLVEVLTLGGTYVKEDVVTRVISLISEC